MRRRVDARRRSNGESPRDARARKTGGSEARNGGEEGEGDAHRARAGDQRRFSLDEHREEGSTTHVVKRRPSSVGGGLPSSEKAVSPRISPIKSDLVEAESSGHEPATTVGFEAEDLDLGFYPFFRATTPRAAILVGSRRTLRDDPGARCEKGSSRDDGVCRENVRRCLGADMGAAAAANLAEQQERSTVGMKTKSKVPSSKSKGTFQGYGGDAPLQTTEAKMQTTRRGANGGPPARPPLHPWLDYPQLQAGGGQERGCGPAHPPPLHHLRPRSPRSSSTRSPATSDSSRRSSPFPSTRCVRRTRTAVAPRPPFPPLAATPAPLSSSRGLSDGARVHELVRSDPSRAVPSSPALAHLRNPPASSNPQDGVKTVQQSVGLGK